MKFFQDFKNFITLLKINIMQKLKNLDQTMEQNM
jgi:hypothetical protein